jgi:hypothetical protein
MIPNFDGIVCGLYGKPGERKREGQSPPHLLRLQVVADDTAGLIPDPTMPPAVAQSPG